MNLLIKNIKFLVNTSENQPSLRKGKDMMNLPMIENAWISIKNGLIDNFGTESPSHSLIHDEIVDANNGFVLPAWTDCHTHLVFAASRENEFLLKIKGASYEEIAAAGGGILNSAKKINLISEDELFEKSVLQLEEIINLGTGAIEIKSGYGLNTEAELKMLKVVKRLKELNLIPIKSTFLGAHALPADFKNDKKGYLKLITNEMIPEISKHKLADYIDIFIEKGFFETNDAEVILETAQKYNLRPRLHIDQMSECGGIDIALKYNAISVDHLEQTADEGMEKLKNSQVIPVLLPSCSFFLKMKYPEARKMIDKGLGVVIASDFNPGSSPSGNLNFSMSLACIYMKMMPEEAINALTTNAAHALELDSAGAIFKGASANLIITKPIPSLSYLPYRFGVNQIQNTVINGQIFSGIK